MPDSVTAKGQRNTLLLLLLLLCVCVCVCCVCVRVCVRACVRACVHSNLLPHIGITKERYQRINRNTGIG